MSLSQVDPFRKHCLINGLDDIGLTMEKMDEIRAFEATRSEKYPWLDGATTRVPKLSAVSDMPAQEEMHTPDPEQWRAEVIERRRLKKEKWHEANAGAKQSMNQ